MNFVEPIKDRKKLKDLKIYLKGEGNIRNYAMVTFGFNSALRISDILLLKWSDICDKNFRLKDYIYMKEKKTGKFKKQRINDNAAEVLNLYIKDLGPKNSSDYVFKSRQGINKPLTRCMAWRIIKGACGGVGIVEKVGTHTMRKTWAYWAYRGGLDAFVIMNALNHSNIKDTMRYICISQDEVNDAFDNFMI